MNENKCTCSVGLFLVVWLVGCLTGVVVLILFFWVFCLSIVFCLDFRKRHTDECDVIVTTIWRKFYNPLIRVSENNPIYIQKLIRIEQQCKWLPYSKLIDSDSKNTNTWESFLLKMKKIVSSSFVCDFRSGGEFFFLCIFFCSVIPAQTTTTHLSLYIRQWTTLIVFKL